MAGVVGGGSVDLNLAVAGAGGALPNVFSSVPFAQFMGGVATVLFMFQYVPQAVYNYRRSSVEGFSANSIIVKLIGSCFLAVNATFTSETWPVIMYGYGNVVQHSIFMIQFAYYNPGKRPMYSTQVGNVKKGLKYLAWILFIFVPIFLGLVFPQTIPYTSSIKPLTQLISHIPQLVECYKLKTTLGCSLFSQVLNFIGGVLGVYMCLVIPPKSPTTYLLYINSIVQATSLFGMAWWYDGIPRRRFTKVTTSV
ncbi:PQ loop repeat family protein [Pelomyxa schiedti]|nr:PQ loop repeat family protein [Pelomyxa schiedti]